VAAKTFTAYRIVAPRWASTAFSGEGARKYGGRWNSPGHPVVYLSESRALCALELLVHLTTPETRAKPFSLIEVIVPERSIECLPPSALPLGWRDSPPTRESQDIGDLWLTEGRALALRVPSVVIPEESNLLLNVAHPEFSQVSMCEAKRFSVDARFS